MHRARALPAALAVVAALIVALLVRPSAGSADPSNLPSNSAEAQAASRAAAAKVASLSGKVKQQAGAVAKAQASASAAEARYHRQLGVLKRAKKAAVRAQAALDAADRTYHSSSDDLGRYVATEYVAGGSGADAANLLAAENPSQLIAVAESQDQLGRYAANLVDRAQRARDVSDAANQRVQAALSSVQTATARVKALRDDAATKYSRSHTALLALQKQLSSAKTSQQTADTVLSMFLGGWAVADPAAAAALNAKYARIAALHKKDPLAAASPSWTQAMADTAVHRALQFLGTKYAWAGGNAVGPTRGVCTAGAAKNDCKIVGFDCSGLVLYGWAPYKSMAHYAATQYGYGRIHPLPSELLPGDLLFWSSNGKVNGIHHVAMYVGDGNVIQAPQSGDIVRITPMGSVSNDYYGATRPLS